MTCTPTSARRTATGRTTASRSPSSAAGTARCRCASTTRARATGCATRSAPTPGSRAAAAPPGDKHAVVVDKARLQALRDLEHPGPRRPLAGRLRRHLEADQQRAAPRRLDLRRRRRPADPARACCAGTRSGPQGRPRDPVHHRRHRRAPPVAGAARRRLATAAAYPPMGARFRLQGVVRRERRSARDARVVVHGDEDLRPGPRRQRLAVVLPGRAERALAGRALIERPQADPRLGVRRRRHPRRSRSAATAPPASADPIPAAPRSRCGSVHAARLRGPFGLWRSLVAHLTGGQGVAGSNPVSPTDVMSQDIGMARTYGR